MSRPNPKRYSLDVENYRSSRAGDKSALFHNALKKMDGVIGYGSAAEVTTFGHQSTSLSKIASLCEELKLQLAGSQNGSVDPRLEIPTDTRDMLVTWLLGDPRGSPFTSQLQTDREALIQQVQILERKLEVCQSENESLKNSLIDMQKKTLQRPPSSPGASDFPSPEHNRTYSAGALYYQDDQLPRQHTTASLPHHYNNKSSNGSAASKVGNENLKRNRSFRESFRRAFNKKKGSSKDQGSDNDSAHKPLNSRTQHFHSLNGPDLADWMNSVGLEMYGELISQLVGTGERLASICSNTEDMMRLGVLNVLHCKKLRLAVEDALADVPSPLSKLDHRWVADWLRDVGLPQYQQPFIDARIDAQMLNALTLEDLEFLKITHPFHITSLRRAIQAFKMCGFDPNYLKIKQEKGGHKLFHWSVYHIMDWLRDIELDEYASALQGTGINGPVVALEPSLTHESIAKAIGVSSSDGLIVTHLGERFVSIIGPIFAQRKVNMMQHKNFAPMDVTAHPLKGKSRPKPAKKSSKQQKEETFLCPPNEVLPILPKSTRSSSMVQLSKNHSGSLRVGMGTTTSNKSVTDAWCNSTISSGHNPAVLGYSPSPPLVPPQPSGSSPTPPINSISNLAINLADQGTLANVSMATIPIAPSPQPMPTPHQQPNGVPAPPPPPAPPIIKAY